MRARRLASGSRERFGERRGGRAGCLSTVSVTLDSINRFPAASLERSWPAAILHSIDSRACPRPDGFFFTNININIDKIEAADQDCRCKWPVKQAAAGGL